MTKHAMHVVGVECHPSTTPTPNCERARKCSGTDFHLPKQIIKLLQTSTACFKPDEVISEMRTITGMHGSNQ